MPFPARFATPVTPLKIRFDFNLTLGQLCGDASNNHASPLTPLHRALTWRIPKTLPILIIQGELDPVGENLVGTRRLVERYKALGLTRIETHYYPGARHVLNETNRDEVQRDVLAWLAKTMEGTRAVAACPRATRPP